MSKYIKPMDFKLSNNFRFYELVRSTEADRLGIDNAAFVTEEILANAVYVAETVLEPIRKLIRRPFTPNSWFRCEELEFVLCTRSFFNGLARQGVEGVERDRTHLLYPVISLLPTEYASYWDAYFETKQHPKGEAVDYEVSGVSNLDLFEMARDNIRYDQLILEFYRKEAGPNSGWVHTSTKRKGANRSQIIRY